MKVTEEQQAIIDTISSDSCDFLKVSACSGSGKTATLVEVVKAIQPKKGLYIAYNKAIATEAGSKFPKEVNCRTTHSLAYGSTVHPYGLKVGYFGYRDIKAKVSYEAKLMIVDHIRLFCLSQAVSFKEYSVDKDIKPKSIEICEDILADMSTGAVTCTHEFYLKLYHILLVNGDIKVDTYDLLLLDEAGDLNPVTLAIFLALPAKKKVMVGDPNQNIYSFNNTINGFEELSDTGVLMGLTKSFRVSYDIADAVEKFARKTFDENMQFKGVTYPDKVVDTSAYITRTNGAMIAKMLELNMTGTPYNLVRPAKTVFALPLALIGLKKGGFISNPQYKFLQDDVDDYYGSAGMQKLHKTPLRYIANIHEDNVGVSTAISMLTKYGPSALIDAQNTAVKYEKAKQVYPLTLCTSHSSKGLEFDEVEIGYDTNTTLAKILSKPKDTWTPQEMEELRLFYVAATRARKVLVGATHLDLVDDHSLGLDGLSD